MVRTIKLCIWILFISISIFAKADALTFATSATFPPFEYDDPSGHIQGFDIDIINALCKEMQTQCTFVSQDFNTLFPSLQQGKVDAVFGALNITEERLQKVDFTKPYYVTTVSLVANKKNAPLLEKSLNGHSIGVGSGTTSAQYLQERYGTTIQMMTYPDEEAAFADLLKGRIDAVMEDTPAAQHWLQESGKDQYVLVGQPITDEKYFGKGYGIAVRKGNASLLNQLNQAIDKIKASGTYDGIVKKYFGE